MRNIGDQTILNDLKNEGYAVLEIRLILQKITPIERSVLQNKYNIVKKEKQYRISFFIKFNLCIKILRKIHLKYWNSAQQDIEFSDLYGC